jgi:hypothetical protein
MIDVIDASSNVQTIGTLPSLGVGTAAGSIPTVGAVEAITGTITSTNGSTVAAVVPLGTAVAGSFLEVSTQGYNTLAIQITGTLTGVTLTVQGTMDSTNWVTIGTSRIQTFGGSVTGSSTVGAGIQYIDVTGLTKARIVSTALSAQSPLIPTGSSVAATMTLATQTGTPSIIGAISAISTISAISAANLAIPGITVDIASSAITTTTSTTAVSPTFGLSYEINIAVTAVTGTSPTLDVIVQESDDTGVNWFDVYYFERITAIGAYRSPKLPLTGNRIRYVQLLGGTSPSFTRTLNRIQSSDAVPAMRRVFDRGMNAAPAATNQSAASVATGGVFTLTGNTTPISMGTKVVITGTNTGTGVITGYVTGTEYTVVSTNGTTSVTLAAVVGNTLTVTAGTLVGLTFTVNELGSGYSTTVCPRGNPGGNTQLIVSAGALTTAPIFKLQGSDDNGTNWYDLSASTLTAVASSTVQLTVVNVRSQLARAIITNAPSGTLNYVAVKTFS